jgi:DNA gyrase inhibitor GyrI
MAHLIEHRAQVLYISASSVTNEGKRRKIVIESRPEYAVLTLQGVKEQYPISWEHLFEAARRHHAENLRIEAKADKQRQAIQRRPS